MVWLLLSVALPPARFMLLCGDQRGVVWVEGLVGVYRPRQPKLSQFYQCIEDYFEQFERIYPDRYEREYGFWRPVVQEVILKYLDCGDLHQGFARVRCQECGEEYMLALICYSYCTSFGLSGTPSLKRNA